jgi:hypothetical protein
MSVCLLQELAEPSRRLAALTAGEEYEEQGDDVAKTGGTETYVLLKFVYVLQREFV